MDRRSFLKNSLIALAGAGSVSTLAGCNAGLFSKTASPLGSRPNIVLIVAYNLDLSTLCD